MFKKILVASILLFAGEGRADSLPFKIISSDEAISGTQVISSSLRAYGRGCRFNQKSIRYRPGSVFIEIDSKIVCSDIAVQKFELYTSKGRFPLSEIANVFMTAGTPWKREFRPLGGSFYLGFSVPQSISVEDLSVTAVVSDYCVDWQCINDSVGVGLVDAQKKQLADRFVKTELASASPNEPTDWAADVVSNTMHFADSKLSALDVFSYGLFSASARDAGFKTSVYEYLKSVRFFDVVSVPSNPFEQEEIRQDMEGDLKSFLEKIFSPSDKRGLKGLSSFMLIQLDGYDMSSGVLNFSTCWSEYDCSRGPDLPKEMRGLGDQVYDLALQGEAVKAGKLRPVRFERVLNTGNGGAIFALRMILPSELQMAVPKDVGRSLYELSKNQLLSVQSGGAAGNDKILSAKIRYSDPDLYFFSSARGAGGGVLIEFSASAQYACIYDRAGEKQIFCGKLTPKK